MKLKNILKKQGGSKLLKQYWQSGVFFTAAAEFLLLGKSRTALEILRLSAQLKSKKKLEKKYKKNLLDFDRQFDRTLSQKSSEKIWICWFQGIENAHYIDQKCYQSIKENIPDKEIIVLTEDNLADYVQFPEYILSKWKNNIITHTHMTDLLRLELLIRYGGMWLDATVFCSGKEIPDYYFDSDLFFYQCLKPGRDGHAIYISSWLISAKTNNKILMAVRHLCYEYWKENNNMMDYFLLHSFFSIVLDYYPEEWRQIVPRDNATPHILLLRLFEQYDERVWESVKAQNCFHKLTYKFTQKEEALEGTYYRKLFDIKD